MTNAVTVTRSLVAKAIAVHVAALRRTVRTQEERQAVAARNTAAANAATQAAIEQARVTAQKEAQIGNEARATILAAQDEAANYGETL